MEWLIENWYVILALAVFVAMFVFIVLVFLNLPTDKKVKALREWLKYAVSIAEKELGGGTGQLKLRMVYDMAITKFPWVAKIYDFEDFSKDVDDALEWLKKQLENNKDIKSIVVGGGEVNA